jgi:hypothetical protein
MVPVLLDLLTIFFLVASAILLWLNLRTRRRTGLSTTPENYNRPEDLEKRSALPPSEAESLMAWSTPFDDWIDLPDGRKLITLKDAATYITELPETSGSGRNGRKPRAASSAPLSTRISSLKRILTCCGRSLATERALRYRSER